MKNKKSLPFLMQAVAVLWGVVAFIMLFLPAIGVDGTDTTYNGLKVVFGYKQSTLGYEYSVFNFSFMNLLTYILILVGIVLSVLSIVSNTNKWVSVIASVAFLVAGIFFFCTIAFTSVNADASKIFASLGGNIKDSFTLAVGAILGGVFSIVAALSSLGAFLMKEVLKK
jgi:hypothetical protein